MNVKEMTTEEARTIWVEALRSGDYHQASGSLQIEQQSGEDRFCCLGVACHKYVELGGKLTVTKEEGYTEYDGEGMILPEPVMQWLGLNYAHGDFKTPLGEGEYHSLTDLNDEGGADFAEIADVIEEGNFAEREQLVGS